MIFDPLLDIFRGKAVTIPPMDGALKPNTLLDDAEAIEVEAPDNLVADGTGFVFSTGNRLCSFSPDGARQMVELARFETPISALARSPSGNLTIGLDDGTLVELAPGGEARPLAMPADFGCPTALAYDADGALYIAQGSARHRPSDWAVDLMEGNAGGSLWRHDGGAGPARRLADGLAFPYGILVAGDGRLIIAEAWRHRLVALAKSGGQVAPVLARLPGYPARLSPAAGGGAWMCIFAPRNRLIEFTLLEHAYRADMMRDVPRDYWIAPALSSGVSFLEPLQCGGVKTMGIHKPWSPSRSYGLVVRLDGALRPAASFHSRANGRRHGVTSAIECAGRTLVAAKGGGAILDIAPLAAERE